METKYTRVIEHYGADQQLLIACEESAELIQAISKWRRNPCEETRKGIITELADKRITDEQVMEICGIEEWEVYNERIRKDQRLKDRVKTEMLNNGEN